MRCTNKNMSLSHTSRRAKKYRTKHKNRNLIKRFLRLFVMILLLVAFGLGLKHILTPKDLVTEYEVESYARALYTKELFAEDLCVVSDTVLSDSFSTEEEFGAISLYNLRDQKVLYAENVHQKLFPASTTKLMTFYLAMKYTSLDEIVEISETATILPSASSRAWLKVGDKLSMKDLLYSMMLASGNDSAIAVAEHIAGSETEFAKLMTEEAKLLGATNTNFVNAHGYHDENHYSTAYDLYLIMKACLKYDAFIELISTSTYETGITEPDGYKRPVYWSQTNAFMTGTYVIPEGVNIVGGKTGFTDQAGACLLLYCQDSNGTPYLATIMGASTRPVLYNTMSSLIATITNEK